MSQQSWKGEARWHGPRVTQRLGIMLARKLAGPRSAWRLATATRFLSSSSSSSFSSATSSKAKPSRWDQIKQTFKQHGASFAILYAGTWVSGFGAIYAAIETANVDGIAILQWCGIENFIDVSGWNPRLVNAVIAAEINDLAEPIRLPLVIAGTPAVSRLRGKNIDHVAEVKKTG